LIDDIGYCSRHAHVQAQHEKAKDKARESASKRGYTSQWRKARIGYLAKHPLCVTCQDSGIVRAATVVDHVTPHKGNFNLFWDSDNWQALCKQCHDTKTASENGGFGNPQR